MRILLAVLVAMACVASAGAQQTDVHDRPEARLPKLDDPLKGAFRASETTEADRTDLAVTVYNNNLALVRDRRKVALFPGELSLTFMDVAQQIKPETVSLRSVSNPGAIRILEQNYEYDLMSPAKLLEKYVGKPVRLVNFSTQVGFSEVDAVLLSTNGGAVYRIRDEIYLGHPGSVVLPEIPENLIAKPSLIWLLDNTGTDQEIEVTYLTNGLSWKADYVLRVNGAESAIDLDAWVTLQNQSGTGYKDARLKLVAGEVNIARDLRVMRSSRMELRAVGGAQPMQEESFAEYHLYSLPRRTTIKQNQTKQVSLFRAENIATKKLYEYRGHGAYYSQRYAVPVAEERIEVFLTFENAESNNLGLPLPAGIMRVYQEDSEGMLQFAGEDRIRHTPKDETIRIKLGNAFDVVGERRQTDFRRVSDRILESTYEIKVRNHKESAVVVDVVEAMPGDWSVLSSSHPHAKRDARTAVFSLPVAPDEEIVLTYDVRIRL